MTELNRETIAKALYELDPYVAPQEYLGCEASGALQLVGGGAYTWEQAKEADAAFAAVSFYQPLTADAYRMADAALASQLSADKVVELYLATDAAGNIYQDTKAQPEKWAQVYKAFLALRDEIDRQIAQRRACPHNPKYGHAAQQVLPLGR